jgi:hypothetical protein
VSISPSDALSDTHPAAATALTSRRGPRPLTVRHQGFKRRLSAPLAVPALAASPAQIPRFTAPRPRSVDPIGKRRRLSASAQASNSLPLLARNHSLCATFISAEPPSVGHTRTPEDSHRIRPLRAPTAKSELGRLCEAAIWRPETRDPIPRPLHAWGGHLQWPTDQPTRSPSDVSLKRLRRRKSPKAHNHRRRRIHPSIPAACFASGLRENLALRVPGQPESW